MVEGSFDVAWTTWQTRSQKHIRHAKLQDRKRKPTTKRQTTHVQSGTMSGSAKRGAHAHELNLFYMNARTSFIFGTYWPRKRETVSQQRSHLVGHTRPPRRPRKPEAHEGQNLGLALLELFNFAEQTSPRPATLQCQRHDQKSGGTPQPSEVDGWYFRTVERAAATDHC